MITSTRNNKGEIKMNASKELLVEFSVTFFNLTMPSIRTLVSDEKLNCLKAAFITMCLPEDRPALRTAKSYVEELLEGVTDDDGDAITNSVSGMMETSASNFRSQFNDADISYVFHWINEMTK